MLTFPLWSQMVTMFSCLKWALTATFIKWRSVGCLKYTCPYTVSIHKVPSLPFTILFTLSMSAIFILEPVLLFRYRPSSSPVYMWAASRYNTDNVRFLFIRWATLPLIWNNPSLVAANNCPSDVCCSCQQVWMTLGIG